MRRIPYTDRLYQHEPSNYTTSHRSRYSSDVNNNSFKIDMMKINYQNDTSNQHHKNYSGQIMSFSPNRRSYQQKSVNKVKRPVTTYKNNEFSELKSKYKLTLEAVNNSMREYERSKNNLWISTVKDTNRYSNSKKLGKESQNYLRGKLHKGPSWKIQDNINDTSSYNKMRFVKPNNQSIDNVNNLSQDGNIQSQGRRTSGILNLLGKNIKQINTYSQNRPKFEYVMRFSHNTRKGYIPNNPSKVNQDAYIINTNISNKTWQHFFAVCDGHGPLGHYVATFIRNNLSNCLCSNKNLHKNPKEVLLKVFQQTYEKLIKESHIDLSYSGSTIISCYLQHNKLYCCNVGDSRAIVGCLQKNKWNAMALSTDHKPSLKKEAERIHKMKGRVQAYKDQFGEKIGPLRVWLQHENVPGLAMTRSFGDLVGASVGVSPIPEIKEFTLNQQHRIIVIGSDGVFQFLSNEQIINLLTPYYEKKQTKQASDQLLNVAYRSWGRHSSIVDDITFILIFLHYNQ